MNVGFIGLGRMGRAMAVNLEKAGHRVRAWNRTRETTADLASKGLSIVSTPDEAFAGDAVISMLGDDTAVRAVFLKVDFSVERQRRRFTSTWRRYQSPWPMR